MKLHFSKTIHMFAENTRQLFIQKSFRYKFTSERYKFLQIQKS